MDIGGAIMGRALLQSSLLLGAGLLLAGCPFGPIQVLPGFWFFHLDDEANAVIALRLLADGTAESIDPPPPGATTTFGGSITWTQDESTFTMMQELSSFNYVFTAMVESRTRLEGTYTRTDDPTYVDAWSASRVY